jgi:hypothetical protein
MASLSQTKTVIRFGNSEQQDQISPESSDALYDAMDTINEIPEVTWATLTIVYKREYGANHLI